MMKAYAIFDGGGVKGAAFAGCLLAAEQLNIRFVGYGGTSAGSIVALLACVGYTAAELRYIMTEELEFSEFLDDNGNLLHSILDSRIPDNPTSIFSAWAWYSLYRQNKSVIRRIFSDYGLYDGNKLTEYLFKKVVFKVPSVAHKPDFTFDDLINAGLKPLKVVASDISKRQPIVYSSDDTNIAVLDAVRASISYPLVFKPVKVHNNYLMDGGLSINLPIHLFESTSQRSRIPIIAFDLVDEEKRESNYNFKNLIGDMLSTALESSEHLLQKTVRNVYHVPIYLNPKQFRTLDFNISKEKRENLSLRGHSDTISFFGKQVPHWTQISNRVESVQAQFVPAQWVEPILEMVCNEVEAKTNAQNIRSNVMLPVNSERKIVAYQYNMSTDTDSDFEIGIEAGASGQAWSNRSPVMVDLLEAESNPAQWGLTRNEQNKVRRDRSAVVCFPIFDVSTSISEAVKIADLTIIGIFSIDTSTTLADTGWREDPIQSWVSESGKKWADILARILT